MKELIQQLSNISDAYDDFIFGVINFAKKNPAHIDILNEYIKEKESLTTSDVIAFIVSQPDFQDYNANKDVQQVC